MDRQTYYVGVEPGRLAKDGVATVGVGVGLIDETNVRRWAAKKVRDWRVVDRRLEDLDLTIVGESTTYQVRRAAVKAKVDLLMELAMVLRESRTVDIEARPTSRAGAETQAPRTAARHRSTERVGVTR